MMTSRRSHLLQIAAAAARLAAFYAIGVLLLLIPFMLITRVIAPTLDGLRGFPIIFGVCFALGFILLAIARRAGLAVLWLLLMVMWVNAVATNSGGLGTAFAFGPWTVFAVPLYLLTAVGLSPSSSQNARAWRSELLVTLVAWLLVCAVSIHYSLLRVGVGDLRAPSATALAVGHYLCTPIPFAIGARELVRIGLAIGRGVVPAGGLTSA